LTARDNIDPTCSNFYVLLSSLYFLTDTVDHTRRGWGHGALHRHTVDTGGARIDMMGGNIYLAEWSVWEM